MGLSPRQAECLHWVGAGKTSDEIATILGLTTSTVAQHITAACRKLDAVNRAQAAVIYDRMVRG